MKILLKGFNILAALLWVGSAFSGRAAVTTVSVQDDVFVPSSSSIHVGDSVVWVWDGSDHNVTSTSHPAAWVASATKTSTTFRFTNTFNATGSFPYECTVHAADGMLGTIDVAAAAPPPPPTITITAPVSGTLLAALANVTISATTTDSNATVTNVQFLVGSTVISNVTTTPFMATAGNLAAGSYTLSAIATDSNGLKATNSVSIRVFNPISIAGGASFSGSSFQFSYSANSGLSYVVQRSADLSQWISLSTNVATGSSETFTDTQAVNNSFFYRVGLLSNP